MKNSLGELVVLDALPGYGKTAFLNKLRTEYESLKWHCSIIPLKRARSELDTVTAAIEAIAAKSIEPPDNLSYALEILLEQLQPGQPQILMFDDVQCLGVETLNWVKRTLAPDLQRELKDLTGNNFLLIFSGHSIRSATPWPLGSRSIELTLFQREAINQFIDVLDMDELWQRRSQHYRRFVVDRILQFSGGHPRASIGLLQELEKGWAPSRSLGRKQDLRVFETHVEEELKRFIENLDPVCKTYLSHLVIFRTIDFATLQVIEQKYELSSQQNLPQLMSTFRQCNLLHSYRPAQGVKALNPVFRLGSLARMSLKDQEQYSKQHQFAQKTYQDWAADNNRSYDDVIRCLGESIYHCLSRMEEQERLEQSELIDCLRYGIQILNRRQTETMDTRSILETLLEDDEDSQSLLQTLNSDWIRLVDYAFVSYSDATTEDNTRPQMKTIQNQCKAITVALGNKIGEVSGTGFWVTLEQKLYVVTCAHVLKQLQCSERDLVKARTFGPNVQDLDLEVLWYRVPEDCSDRDWSSRQDIAILRPVSTTVPQISVLDLKNLLPLSHESMSLNGYRQATTLYSFGYPAPKRLKGESFASLVFDEQVGNGFIKLLNLGPTKVEGGVSGAPLCHVEGRQLVGMIHARLGTDVVYCIPATTILGVLADLQLTL
ncbi:S1 family peptidase [Leptolyngbya sp. Heron Island J]|uniref:S1 family peptidase n=1 Tax=Leptolyngbya sp. Heron Island J TaxID=1385935 RepID=UPI001377EB5A|nr:serine protease [Leptolyngbya sp. Heron Island J]